MGYFSAKIIDELVLGLDEALAEIDQVRERILYHKFKKTRAYEYAVHGICRRLDTLKHCSSRVYELLPPNLDHVPDRQCVKEATVHIQSFISNVIGILDNLAWVWISENDLKHRDGTDFSPREVKLSRDCRDLWRDLPINFREKVIEFREWFLHAYEWRDALVHRIPLYIPPFTVRDTELYNKIDAAAYKALIDGDIEKHRELDAEMDAMKFFSPIIMHSFSEEAEPAVFHANLLSDMKTVSVLTMLLLDNIIGEQGN
ncbi:hypothetical protein [Thalassospira tepidiphila]|uniref:hypothetical protein n=1 Tax=Thalassospira tepidiphila TaxID=393657 RepID=UPI002921FF93|nr:hypothetical protein MACH01_13850 [Thalassospira tepidiphila]